MSIPDICKLLILKADEKAFLCPADSKQDPQIAKTRKKINKELRTAVKKFRESKDYKTVDPCTKAQVVDVLDGILLPWWKSGDNGDTEEAIYKCLSAAWNSDQVGTRLKDAIDEAQQRMRRDYRERQRVPPGTVVNLWG